MATALSLAMDWIEAPMKETSSEAVGQAYLDALRAVGATSLWARQFHLTPNWVDPKVNAAYKVYNYACLRETSWWSSAARAYADNVCPLSIGSTMFARPFFLSEVTRGAEAQYGQYWEAMAEFGVADTLGVVQFGPHNVAGGVTIWVAHRDFSPEETGALRLGGTLVLERMRTLKAPLQPQHAQLTDRERDCLALVADGKSDWEISVILSIAKTTAHAHVENAKRKLGARTRAQAVARLILNGLI